MKFVILTILAVVAFFATAEALPCSPLDFGEGSVVCVCNATYCDTLEPLAAIPANQFYHLTSSKEGKRFEVTYGNLNEVIGESNVTVKIDRSAKFQKIIGFGGSFTDAATINIASLSENLQKNVLESYYGKTGLQYNIGRVNMASCDFSTRLYSYDDVEGDESLEHFALVEEDTEYKIPYIQKALALNPNIKMFASPWTAPKWMKTNNEYYGMGSLKTEYYQAWANYFVKFLDEYKKRNVTFWAVTAQNEPSDGLVPAFPFNCMGWTAEQQRDWIRDNLGPALTVSDHQSTKIIILDDQRLYIVSWINTVMADDFNKVFVSGVGVHWYMDPYVPATVLDDAHALYPDLFILATEACSGANPLERPVVLGSWYRAERYAFDIIQDLNHWVGGWTDWNLVLDMEGGPNWEGNTVDAPIIADKENDQVFKQPMYYALGHFSKFIPEDSVRVGRTSEDLKDLDVLVVERTDGVVVAVIQNSHADPLTVSLEDGDTVIQITVEARSLHTICY